MQKIKSIILLLVLQHNISAQTYIPVPTTKAVWTISTLAQGSVHGIYKYGMFGDTIINNVTYKKIYYNSDYNFNVANSIYYGAIREFSKKVYKINPGTNTEGLLYNFNLNIGDSAKSITRYGGIAASKVTGIDFIVYNGQVYRRWIFPGEYWIEGIGSSYGFLNPLAWGFDWCESLMCVSIDGTVQYQNTAPACSTPAPFDCDGGFASINEHSIEKSKSFVFPNPFSNSAILKTSIELDDATLKIYDILGQEVLTSSPINGQEIKINKGNLSNGNYYYKLSQNGDLISKGKFIIE